jgi:hypothetical protein
MCHFILEALFEGSQSSSSMRGLEAKVFTELEGLHICPHELWHPVYPSRPVRYDDLSESEEETPTLKDYLKEKDVVEFKRAYGEIC